MGKISVIDRILLLATCLLAAYQISSGMDGLNLWATWGFTTGFGTLLVAGLLLIIMGFDGLERQVVVIVSTLIPLSISFGLVSLHFPAYTIPYLLFCAIGFSIITITRFTAAGKPAAIVLALVHGIAGVLITFLPAVLSFSGQTRPGYILVGLGGALIGIGGLLFTFVRTGKPLLSLERLQSILPTLLLMMTVAFIGGFSFL